MNLFFRLSNGAWVLLLLFFAVFLIAHIAIEWRFKRLSMGDVLSLPLGMQVAISILVADIGNLIIALVVWLAPDVATHGFPATMIGFILAGQSIRAVGMLCKIRVFTSASLGHWPWIGVGLVTSGYVLLSLAISD